MEYPPIGLQIVAILNTGEEKVAYWDGNKWMQGVENDPVDILLEENVVSWRDWP